MADPADEYQKILDKYSSQIKTPRDPALPSDQPQANPPMAEVNTPPPPEVTLPPPSPEIQPPPPDPTPPPISPEPNPPPPPIFSPPKDESSVPIDNPASPPPPANPLFKFLFFLSLFTFIIVTSLLVYRYVKAPASPPPQSDTGASPITPAPGNGDAPDSGCYLNDRRLAVGESFPAADGCNTCTCDPDNTISCTLEDCQAPE